uniref:Uncharacterized protein n=1 Tax=Arundo donax TaxID=35708 RepID=A0A0A8ZCL9_ARUDO
MIFFYIFSATVCLSGHDFIINKEHLFSYYGDKVIF